LEWQVPYSPGKLVAKGYTDGNLVATDLVETVTAPDRVQLAPERHTLQADGEDTIVVPVSIQDAQGRLVANANNRVTFQLTGGRLLGVGNGNPGDHDPDRANQRNAFNGHCLVVIQAGTKPETLELTATSPDLASARTTFTVK
jgi:beta-galactosidase